eukprot:gb/GECH01007730.1/.p1 GENE.gb/GECH01007730.1/~~gb/GECH01007730.1/.p1  ORF type:complete len:170 (+),score=18.95 gb/GECH01007730.1/:1-510(+)
MVSLTTHFKFTAGILVMLLIISVHQMVVAELCPSFPHQISSIPTGLPSNPDTDTIDKCTSHTDCAWCKKGSIEVDIAGESGKVSVSGFCWDGNIFSLSNNSVKLGDNLLKAEISCPVGDVYWGQPTMPGIALFFVILGCSAIALCFVCIAVTFLCLLCCRRRKRSYLKL